MLLRIAKNDWRNLKSDRTLWAVAALLACTILYGVYNGASWVRFQQKTINAAVADEAERHEHIKKGIEDANAGRTSPPSWKDPRNPYAVGYRLGSRYATMPPAPLASLAVGQSDLLPYYFRVTVNSRDTLIGNDEIENPIHLLSGRFDLAFVIIYLFPLLILALSYNLISGEKEDGTLAMTLAQPVSLRTVALGKIGFRAAFVLGVGAILSIAGAVLSGVDLSAEGVLPRLAVWIGVVTVYALFWFGLAVAVNARGYSSSTNAMALSGFWLVFVLLIPSLLNVVVKTVHPVPSRVEMIQGMRRASDEVVAQRSRVMAQFLEDHPELAPAASADTTAQYAIRVVAVTEELERRVQPVLAAFDDQVSRQQELADRYRFLSPAVLTQAALYDLAGTGVHRYKHFLRLAGDYHEQWQGHIQPMMVKSVKLDPEHIDKLPKWHYREEGAATVLNRVWPNFAALAILTLLAIGFGARTVRRYPVAG
jgi:ABC-2 type transport system permease protein